MRNVGTIVTFFLLIWLGGFLDSTVTSSVWPSSPESRAAARAAADLDDSSYWSFVAFLFIVAIIFFKWRDRRRRQEQINNVYKTDRHSAIQPPVPKILR